MNKRTLSYLKSLLYWEPSFVLNYYLHKKSANESVDYVFMADGKMLHGGLFDRLKGAISIYALSKVHNKKFGLYFTEPFNLYKYLEPSQFEWKLNQEDLYYSFPFSRPIIAYSELYHPDRLMRKRIGQIHFYFGGDILNFINEKYKTTFEWTALYHELFRPSDYLMQHVDEVKVEIGAQYFAVHLRFMNLLGDKVENEIDSKLSEEERKDLINSCLIKIKELCSSMKIRAVIFSDSMVFLQEVKKELPEVYIVPGNARHIGTAGKTTDDENLKLFTDMYLMVDAQKVYSIIGRGLYASAFPEYSAMIGDKPLERVKL